MSMITEIEQNRLT